MFNMIKKQAGMNFFHWELLLAVWFPELFFLLGFYFISMRLRIKSNHYIILLKQIKSTSSY